LKEEDFINLVKDLWNPINQEETVVQFAQNLKNFKKSMIEWVRKKKQEDKHELVSMKEKLQRLYDIEGGGY
jgi:hypothetical protein